MKFPSLRPNWLLFFALFLGCLLGILSNVEAYSQFSFAGYSYNTSNKGTYAIIPYLNPTVTVGQSLEWVMAGANSGPYIQSGWIKRTSDSVPKHFTEYQCATVCQFYFGNVSSGSHYYKVELVSSTWSAYVDGVVKTTISTSTLGMTNADRALYSGETSDTNTWLGGTSTSHFRMSNLQFKNTTDTWYQVNTNYLTDLTTSGTDYRASNGYTSPYTWVDNWTAR